MSSWTERGSEGIRSLFESRFVQLVGTAILSGTIVATTILTYQTAKRQQRIDSLKSSIPEDSSTQVVNSILDPQAARSHYDLLHDSQSSAAFHDASSKALVEPGAQKIASEHKLHEDYEEDTRSAGRASKARQGDYDEDLILEQLARNRVFLTDGGLSKLRSSFVIVVGCGGVGSHAVAALARSGVSKIRLVDFDQVTLSSLNRHAVATLADVGIPKVHCIRKRLEQITPWVQFDCRNELFRKESAAMQLAPWDGQQPDYIVDAIDNIDSKVELLQFCHDNKLPVISSMGAGCKSDPTRVFIGDISASIEDPLSRSTRRRLRALGIANGIPVVFSTEKATPGKAQLLPLPEDEYAKGSVGDLGVLPDFRVRILPVLGTMPAVFGLCLANFIMLEITGYPRDQLQSKGREKMYEGILANLQGIEERLARDSGEDARGLRIPVTQDDVGYLVEEVYRGRSVVSGLPTRLALIRWDRDQNRSSLVQKSVEGQKSSKLLLRDLVCMTKEEAAAHERDVLKGGKSPKEVYDSATLDLVKQRKEEESRYAKYR